MKFNPKWTEEQRVQAVAKVKALTEAFTVKKKPGKRNRSAARMFRAIFGKNAIPAGVDVDHIVDLQLGGADDILNMQLLDSSVNRSLGAQIRHAIKYYDEGTVFGEFTIS